MITGSCLCGNVKYSISGKVGDIVHCHCKTCQKAHGSAFSSVASVNDTDFKVFDGENLKPLSPPWVRNVTSALYVELISTQRETIVSMSYYALDL